MKKTRLITEFLKTGKLPEMEIKIPKDLIKEENGELKTHIRDYYDAIFNTPSFLDDLNFEDLNLIISNTDFDFKKEMLRLLIFYPEKGISLIKNKHLNTAVFEKKDPDSIDTMEFFVSIYLSVIYEAEQIGIKDEVAKRLMTYLLSQKEYLEKLFNKIELLKTDEPKDDPTEDIMSVLKDMFPNQLKVTLETIEVELKGGESPGWAEVNYKGKKIKLWKDLGRLRRAGVDRPKIAQVFSKRCRWKNNVLDEAEIKRKIDKRG